MKNTLKLTHPIRSGKNQREILRGPPGYNQPTSKGLGVGTLEKQPKCALVLGLGGEQPGSAVPKLGP